MASNNWLSDLIPGAVVEQVDSKNCFFGGYDCSKVTNIFAFIKKHVHCKE